MRAVARRFDVDARPAVVAALAVGVFVVVMLARLVIAADGDITQFVVAGATSTDASRTPVHLHVFDSGGYDGQFYWRLAINPSELSTDEYAGVRLDDGLRAGRIAYPALAWATSLGNDRWVATALVVVNLLAVGGLVVAGAVLARSHGLPTLWGLLPATATGLIMSVARDLNEVVMCAAVIGGVAALQFRRPWIAAALWSLAVLTHEQSLYVIAALALVRVVRILTRNTAAGSTDAAWIVPSCVFVAWQSVAAVQVGGWPVLSSGGASTGAPFVGLVRGLGDLDRAETLVLLQLASVVLLVVAAVRSSSDLAPDDRWLRLALALGVVLSVCLSFNVWTGPAELRQIVLVPVLASTILLSAGRRPGGVTIVVIAAAWSLTTLLRVLAV